MIMSEYFVGEIVKVFYAEFKAIASPFRSGSEFDSRVVYNKGTFLKITEDFVYLKVNGKTTGIPREKLTRIESQPNTEMIECKACNYYNYWRDTPLTECKRCGDIL